MAPSGKLIVEPDRRYNPREGLIEIPASLQRSRSSSGTILSYTPGSDPAEVSVGQRILWRGGTGARFDYLGYMACLVRETDVEAVIEGDGGVKAGAVIQRCAWCLSKGEGNVLMFGGYCPRCGRNELGDKREG